MNISGTFLTAEKSEVKRLAVLELTGAFPTTNKFAVQFQALQGNV